MTNLPNRIRLIELSANKLELGPGVIKFKFLLLTPDSIFVRDVLKWNLHFTWIIRNKNPIWKAHGEDNALIRTVTWTRNDFRGWLLWQRWPPLSCTLWGTLQFFLWEAIHSSCHLAPSKLFQNSPHTVWTPLNSYRRFTLTYWGCVLSLSFPTSLGSGQSQRSILFSLWALQHFCTALQCPLAALINANL